MPLPPLPLPAPPELPLAALLPPPELLLAALLPPPLLAPPLLAPPLLAPPRSSCLLLLPKPAEPPSWILPVRTYRCSCRGFESLKIRPN